MKKTLLTMLLTCLGLVCLAQVETKIDSELLASIRQQKGSDEKHRIIIVMEEQYDEVQMNRQTQQLTKAEKRTFVINELQRFSAARQKKVLELLTEATRVDGVDDIYSFWLFNGISCLATSDIIYEVAKNMDVKIILPDFETNYIPEGDSFVDFEEPSRGNAWNVGKVKADSVWALGYTGAGVLVGVLDTGVNYNHTDIANNMWDGGEAYPNHGYDFYNDDNDPIDDNGHGTHCAGTVSSYGTNGTQCGIAKDAKIMALKVLGASANGSAFTRLKAEEFAISHGCDILSMSLGGSGQGAVYYERMVAVNIMNCGVILSVAAGNDGAKTTTYPVPTNINNPGNCPAPWGNPDQTTILDGGHTACVTVGSVNSSDERHSTSSIGPVTWTSGNHGSYTDYPYTEGSSTEIGLIKPDVAAPGVNIISLKNLSNTGYSTKTGTSMATPCVAGIMALMLEADPTLTPVEIDSILETTAVQCGSYTKKNNYYGAGRVDALAAVKAVVNSCPAPTNLAGQVDGCTVALTWSAADGIDSYRIYRNGIIIASDVSGTSYADTDVPAGHNAYYIRSNRSGGGTSMSSNIYHADITVNQEMGIPSNLHGTLSGTEISLSWNAPQMRDTVIGYALTSSDFDGGGPNSTFIFEQRYPFALLQSYAGMQINSVHFLPGTTNTEYHVQICKGFDIKPGEELFSASITPTDAVMQEVDLASPLIIDPSSDYWLVITANGLLGYDQVEGCTEGFYYNAPNIGFNFYMHDLAWTMYLGVSEAVHTYDIYRSIASEGLEMIAEGISSLTYSDAVEAGQHVEYSVSANSHGYHSLRSDILSVDLDIDFAFDDHGDNHDWSQGDNWQGGVIPGYGSNISINGECELDRDMAIQNLVIEEGSSLTILDDRTLIASEITTTQPSQLVIVNNGQLYCNSEDVYATYIHTIERSTSSHNGWHTIASPFAGPFLHNLTHSGYDFFDLYAYDESAMDEEWKNYKESSFELVSGRGYLYANSGLDEGDSDLVMAGVLNPSDATVTVPLSYASSYEGIRGFNLIGNPFPHKLSMDDIQINGVAITEFYRIEGHHLIRVTEGEILPGESIFIRATGDGQSVVMGR